MLDIISTVAIIIFVFLGVLIFLVGLVIFPGFGLAEFSGLASLIIAALWAFLIWPTKSALVFLLASIFFSAIIAGILIKLLPKSAFGGDFVLEASETPDQGYIGVPTDLQELIGKSGICKTDLHPVGDIIIENRRLHATARDGFLPRGTEVTIFKVEGNVIVVEPEQTPGP